MKRYYWYVRGRIPWLVLVSLFSKMRRCQSCPAFSKIV
jgi:hypothetical protein